MSLPNKIKIVGSRPTLTGLQNEALAVPNAGQAAADRNTGQKQA